MIRIDNLGGETIRTSEGGEISIDGMRDATVSSNGEAFASLYVGLQTGPLVVTGANLQLAASETRVEVVEMSPGSFISRVLVDGIEIGTGMIWTGSISISFNEHATAATIETLIRALGINVPGFNESGFNQYEVTVQVWGRDSMLPVVYSQTITVMPEGAKVLTSAAGATIGTGADDTFYVEQDGLSEGDRIDGGEGNDALQMLAQGVHDLTQPDTLTGIEVIRGSNGSDTFILNANQLAGIRTIDGGGSMLLMDSIEVKGSFVDLSNTTITNVYRLALDSGATVKFADKAAALQILSFGQNITIDLSNEVLTEGELTQLYTKGAVTVIDAEGSHSNATPVVSALDGDHIRMSPGDTIHLDDGRNASVSDDAETFTFLNVRTQGMVSTDDILDIDTTGSVTVNASDLGLKEVVVDGIAIGTFFQYGSNLTFSFNANATLNRVETLIRALTYTYQGTDLVASRSVIIELTDLGGKYVSSEVTIAIAQPGTTILTSDTDSLTGTATDDTYFSYSNSLNLGDQIDGGAGTDTLALIGGGNFDLTKPASLNSIEVIRGSEDFDRIILKASQLAGIEAIDGGGDVSDELRVLGLDVDLSQTALTNIGTIYLDNEGATIKFSDKDTALNIFIEGWDFTIDLSSETLSDAEILQLLRNGAKAVIDATGTHANLAPEMTNLDGDRVSAIPDEAVLLDDGGNAAIIDDGDSFIGLRVSVASATVGEDVLGFDLESSVTTDEFGGISIDGITVGTFDYEGPNLSVTFDVAATKEHVEALIRALTYTYQGGEEVTSRSVFITLTGFGGKTVVSEVDVTISKTQTIPLTAGTDTAVGTSGDDIFTAYWDSFSDGDRIDGGDGTDTLALLGGGGFDLTAPASLTSIEVIRGTGDDDWIALRASQLAGVATIDGGGTDDWDDLQIHGDVVDLTPTMLIGIESLSLDDGATIKLADKATALGISLNGRDLTVDLSGETLTSDEILRLHQQGASTVIDATGPYTNLAPVVAGLDGDLVVTPAGQPVHIDAGQNATVSDDGASFRSLSVEVLSGLSGEEVLGIDTNGSIKLSPSGTISINSTTVATLYDGGNSLWFSLEATATKDDVQAIIHALTYTYRGPEDTTGSTVAIQLEDFGGRFTTSQVVVAVTQPGAIRLTSGTDIVAQTTGNETYVTVSTSLNADDQIDGGNGIDTLALVGGGFFDLTAPGSLKNIEIIKGSSDADYIWLDAARLASIQEIDAGVAPHNQDVLQLVGTSLNLTGKTITGIDVISLITDNAEIVVANKEQALKVVSYGTANTRLVLHGEDLTADERAAIFGQGIMAITDKSGTYTSGSYGLPPVVRFLDGDHVTAGRNATVHLDAGANAVVENPEGRIDTLGVYFQAAVLSSAGHHLGLDASRGVTLSAEGWTSGSSVFVDQKEVGILVRNGANSDGDGSLPGGDPDAESDLNFAVIFNPAATAADAQAILRALTYSYSGNPTSAQELEAFIYLNESMMPFVETEVSVKISVPGSEPPLPPALLPLQPPAPLPTSFETTSDFTLPADALTVTAVGTANVMLTGNDLGNTITGNDGRNTINAGGGNDIVSGGRGNDVLMGGSGKDAFVFNTKLGTSKTDRKVNFDAIKDFSVKDDSLYLDNAVFKKLGNKGSETKPVKLNKDFFSLDRAKDTNDYVVYNKKTGILSYDVDGSGAKAAVEFAQVKKGTNLKYDDFFVI